MTLTVGELMGSGLPSTVAANIISGLSDTEETAAIATAVAATGVVSTAPTRTVAAAVTAAGTVIGDGTQLTAFANVVTTTAASTGVILPDAPTGHPIFVQNDGANTLNVFPPNGSGTLNGGSAGAAITVATTVGIMAVKVSATDWLCVRLGAKET